MTLAAYEKQMTAFLSGNYAALEGEIVASSQPQYYLNAIMQNYKAALNACFPCCRRLLGENCWDSLLQHYFKNRYVNTPDVSELGEAFSDFLQTMPFIHEVPYISDMAKFEWCWFQCFHGRRGETFSVQSTFALAELWEMCQPEYEGDFQLGDPQGVITFVFSANDEGVHIHATMINQIEK